MASSSTDTITAPPPFDKLSADIILRTSDHVYFRVYKLILGLASPFFESMFSLPQPQEQDQPPPSSVPIVDVTEGSKVWDSLLRTCYPTAQPWWNDTRHVVDVLVAAQKYEVEHTVAILETAFKDLAYDNPLRAWAIACQNALEPQARLAALVWKEARNVDQIYDEFDEESSQVTAAQYCRLLEFVNGTPVFFCEAPSLNIPRFPSSCIGANKQFNFSDADVVVRSCDGVELLLHSHILRLLSAEIGRLLDASLEVQEQCHGRLMVVMPERGVIVTALMMICYPSPDYEEPLVLDFSGAYEILEAAQKYKLHRAVSYIQGIWMNFMDEHPLAVCLIAAHMNWPAETRRATLLHAIRCATRSQGTQAWLYEEQDYCFAMEVTTAHHFREVYRLAAKIRPIIENETRRLRCRTCKCKEEMQMRVAEEAAVKMGLIPCPLSTPATP